MVTLLVKRLDADGKSPKGYPKKGRVKKVPRRISREFRTISAMINIYCRANHRGEGEICAECRELLSYAEKRLEKCPYGADKPACNDCPIHCYTPEKREQVRAVMRYSGPRMMFRHPILALYHWIDGLKKVPEKP